MGAGKGYFTDYPKRVAFILSNEFCERFSFYGMKAILVIFLTRALNFSDDDGTALYHGFNMACYFTPLFGALLADGYLGHYKTIFIISIVYAIGNVVMAAGAIPYGGNYISAISFVGLLLIAIGTGGIKPCVAAFGANQFKDDQIRQKQTFFSMFYMSINIGSLMSMIITPLIRSNVTCFHGECYALAFGVPACLMLVAVAFFVLGTHWYTITPPGENIIGKFFGCIGTALKAKCCCSRDTKEKQEHWLDYADSKYEKAFVADVKSVMRVLFMFIPLPMFYALFDQQGSSWILQAGRLNGDFGSFVLEPDLIQVINPILVVCLVPLFESLLFPCLEKLKIPNRPLQRLGFGMFLAGSAFIISGFLQIAVDNSQPPSIPAGQSRFKIINASPCTISGGILDNNSISIENFTMKFEQSEAVMLPEIHDITAGQYEFSLTFTDCSGTVKSSKPFTDTFQMEEGGSYNMIAYWDKSKTSTSEQGQLNQANQSLLSRTLKGQARIQIFSTWENTTVVLDQKEDPVNVTYLKTSLPVDVPHKKLTITAGSVSAKLEPQNGAVYTSVFHYSNTDADESSRTMSFYQDISPNSLSILYMLPQYLVMTTGEVFFSVTGLSFAYSQSPPTMKAVLQAGWLLNNSLGNCLVMIIKSIGHLPSQVIQFFMFAGLMYLTVIIFAVMSLTYVYVEPAGTGGHPDQELDDDEKGSDNLGMEPDELPPKYDVVMTDGESPIIATYM